MKERKFFITKRGEVKCKIGRYTYDTICTPEGRIVPVFRLGSPGKNQSAKDRAVFDYLWSLGPFPGGENAER